MSESTPKFHEFVCIPFVKDGQLNFVVGLSVGILKDLEDGKVIMLDGQNAKLPPFFKLVITSWENDEELVKRLGEKGIVEQNATVNSVFTNRKN